jgi:DNA-binding NtrC family response regulator
MAMIVRSSAVGTPVFVVSAHPPEDFYPEAQAAGCSANVTKPFDFDELDQLIGRLVSQRLMCEVK